MRVCVSEAQIWSRSYCLKRPSDYSIMSDHHFPHSKLGHILQTHSPCLDEAIYPTWLVVVSHYVLSVSCILSKPPHDCWFMLVSYPSILASNPGMFFLCSICEAFMPLASTPDVPWQWNDGTGDSDIELYHMEIQQWEIDVPLPG